MGSATRAKPLGNGETVLIQTETGKVVEIPKKHTVFAPVGVYFSGDLIDPQTVDVEPYKAAYLAVGNQLIIDNRVEVVTKVAV